MALDVRGFGISDRLGDHSKVSARLDDSMIDRRRDERILSELDRLGLTGDGGPEMLGNVRSDWSDEESLEFDVLEGEIHVHTTFKRNCISIKISSSL